MGGNTGPISEPGRPGPGVLLAWFSAATASPLSYQHDTYAVVEAARSNLTSVLHDRARCHSYTQGPRPKALGL